MSNQHVTWWKFGQLKAEINQHFGFSEKIKFFKNKRNNLPENHEQTLAPAILQLVPIDSKAVFEAFQLGSENLNQRSFHQLFDALNHPNDAIYVILSVVAMPIQTKIDWKNQRSFKMDEILNKYDVKYSFCKDK